MDVPAARLAHATLIREHEAKRQVALAEDVSLLWASETTFDHELAEALWDVMDPAERAAVRARHAPWQPSAQRLVATLSIEAGDDVDARRGYYAGLEHAIALIAGDVVVPARVIGSQGTQQATAPTTRLAFDVPASFDRRLAVLSVGHAHLETEVPLPTAVQVWPGTN